MKQLIVILAVGGAFSLIGPTAIEATTGNDSRPAR